jgi:glycosyltransferase involved in cell wall biosynthesis
VLLELARALVSRGHRVTVYSHRLGRLAPPTVSFVHVPEFRAARVVDDLFVTATAGRRVRRGRHDVTVTAGHWLVPGHRHVYVAGFAHNGWRGSWTPATRPGSYHRLHAALSERLESRALRSATEVVACSELVARDLAVRSTTPVHVIPNGVDTTAYRPASSEQRAAARRSLGLPADSFVVGFVGEFRTGRKGLEPLVSAIAEGNEHLVVAGDGDARRVQPLGGRGHAVGVVDPHQIYAAVDLVAVPSSYEPFSLVALEAAASGVPVLATSHVGAVTHLGDGAVAVPDADPRTLRAALDVVRASDRTAMARAARVAAEHLDWSVTSGRLADLVQRVVTRPAPTLAGEDAQA